MSEDLFENGGAAPERAEAVEAPAPAAAARRLGETGLSNVAVKAVSEKTGEKRDGSPYTRFSIKGSDGAWYTTFVPKLGDLAKSARETGAFASLGWRAIKAFQPR